MKVVESSLAGIPLLRVTGDVDHASAPDLDSAAQIALGQDGGRLFVDLTDSLYLDSGGLAVLLWVLRRVRETGWLGVIGSSPNLLRLFDIVGLASDSAFRSFSNQEEASRAVNAAAG